MSELKLENELETFRQQLESILKDIRDPNGLPIDLFTVFNQVLPAFFDLTKLSQCQYADISTTSTMALRTVGYGTFYQSLTNYTTINFSTLNTAFLERILFHAVSIFPLAKIAQCLGMDDPVYNTECHISDRLSVLVGALFIQFGLPVVDKFLHQLFAQHIFNGKQFALSDSPARVHSFGTMIKSRGGTFVVNYEQIQDNANLKMHKWECAVIYQLTHNSPYVLHKRTGQNKKQARTRILHDIDNFYTRNSHVLVQHCSPAPKPTLGHQPTVETLSIPIDQLYQYDDNIQQSIPTTQLAAKRTLETTMEGQASTNGGDDNKHVSILTHALLYDFSKLSCSEPLSSISIPPSGLHHLPTMDEVGSITPAPSPSSTTTIKTESTQDEIMQDGDQDGNHTKKQCINPIDAYQPEEQYEHDKIDWPLLSPISPQPNDTDLSTIASHLISRLSIKERLRLKKYSSHLAKSQNDAKGCLKNLAGKLNGHYVSSVGQCTQTKSGGYFSVTVRFGIVGLELVMTRHHTRKSEAEGMVAHAIFALLETSIATDGNVQHPLGISMVQ